MTITIDELVELALTIDPEAKRVADAMVMYGHTYALDEKAQTAAVIGKRGKPLKTSNALTFGRIQQWIVKRQKTPRKQPLYYEAEKLAGLNGKGPDDHLQTVADCERWIRKVMRDPAVVKKFGRKPFPDVRDGRGCSNAHYAYEAHEVSLPRWSRTEFVILHELAHLFSPTGGKGDGHGAAFKWRLMWLVGHFIGEGERMKLYGAYSALGCRV